MFDELHDPNPPNGDEHQLNVVLDRARAVRRRRRTVFAGLGVFVLAAGAAIATAITDDPERIATIDDNSTTATQPSPIAPDTTSASTTEEPDSSSPATSVVVATAPEPSFFDGLEPCSTARSCSYDNIDNGSLVQLDASGAGFEWSDDQPGLPARGPALARIYHADGAEVVELDGIFDPFSTFLLAVNSDDVAYVWQPGEEPNAAISAYPLTGRTAGRQVGRWEIEAGQDRFVTTTSGVAAVPTGDGQLVSEVVAPWVDADGEPSTDLGPHFTVRRDNLLTIGLAGDGIDQRWVDVPTNTNDGVPRIFALDSGISVLIDDGRNDGPTPIYLFPDGTFERGAGLGATIWHVLPDGRFVRDDNDYPLDVSDLYAGLREPTTAEILTAATLHDDRSTVALGLAVHGEQPEWWMTSWVVREEGVIPIHCIGSPSGAACSPDIQMSADAPPIEIIGVGGAPSQLVVRLRFDVATVQVAGVEGIQQLEPYDPMLPSDWKLAAIHVPTPERDVELIALDSAGNRLGSVTMNIAETDPRASGTAQIPQMSELSYAPVEFDE